MSAGFSNIFMVSSFGDTTMVFSLKVG